ncbi:MAG TPA: carboxypeptidase regulatory-like domain-containing protein [Lentimicrobium sp.]|nr:carboxypeptidase regulatory-like domain-containing protein [Lentimicrobium sp.]
MRKKDHFISQAIKHLVFIASFLMISSVTIAQVTTAGMNGRIASAAGESLPGATVIAVHTPSGTQYGTTTDMEGYYRIPNMRVGGPYNVTVSYVGYQTVSSNDVNLNLGQTFNYSVVLTEEAANIEGVEVISSRSDLFDGNRTGAATNLNNQTISVMPTISRSINDFTRLTPQASVGNSFASRDGRYNNITIDGANFNNNFGLSSTNLPGGDAQPISLDAIEEISVNIAPFDIRQSNFTGANINAITRSGTNTLTGSAYMLFRDETFNGKYIGEDRRDTLTRSDNTVNTVGFRLGGPILKDKLFFFANYEYEKRSYPGVQWRPNDSTNGIYEDADKFISRTSVEDMQTVSDFLKETYGYDPGSYTGFDNFESKNHKILGRLDWNINKNNKFTFRYNYVKSTNDQETNATSAPGTRSSFGRIGERSMSFGNAMYGFLNTVSSFAGELNTIMGNKAANKFLVTYTRIRDTRDSDSDIFPFVDIYKDGDPYMSLGYELFTFENDVKNNVLTFTDNFNYFMGKHTFTFGASYDYLYFGNSYKRYGTSYYRYASMEDFMNGALPTTFGLTYPYEGAGDGYAELNFGYASVYAQDEFQMNPDFKITAGLRLETPMYYDDLIPNPAVTDSLTFIDLDGNDETLDIGKWPDPQILVSPRIGFNWDVKGDRTFQLRGGSGIFTGRLPFVWFTNQPTNSGVLQNTVEVTKMEDIEADSLYFNADPLFHASKFGSQPGDRAPGSIAKVDDDFKMPQVWRTNLAADFKLPYYDLVFTVEALYSKDINAIIQRNANQVIADSTFQGVDNRPRFFNRGRVNSAISSAMVLDNAEGGHATMLTFMLTRPFTQGLFGMISYTFTASKDLTSNPGSAAFSAWSSNPTVLHQNAPGRSFSQFAVPHRVIGALSYHKEYINHLGTTVSLFYEGANQGRISYIYSNDMNGDGNAADLIYIPASEGEINFVDIKDKDGNVINDAQSQSDAFWAFVSQDKYMRDHKGMYAQRAGALLPWRNRFDVKILQDIFADFGTTRRYTLQLSVDLLNIGNMINSDWGTAQKQILGNYDMSLLKFAGANSEGEPTYNFNKVGSSFPTSSFTDVLSTTSTWGAQVGLRFIF